MLEKGDWRVKRGVTFPTLRKMITQPSVCP
jgi:hypothetical protein